MSDQNTSRFSFVLNTSTPEVSTMNSTTARQLIAVATFAAVRKLRVLLLFAATLLTPMAAAEAATVTWSAFTETGGAAITDTFVFGGDGGWAPAFAWNAGVLPPNIGSPTNDNNSAAGDRTINGITFYDDNTTNPDGAITISTAANVRTDNTYLVTVGAAGGESHVGTVTGTGTGDLGRMLQSNLNTEGPVGSISTFTFEGLTDGDSYRVDLYLALQGAGSRTMSILADDGLGTETTSGNVALLDEAAKITATFIADGSTQDFTIRSGGLRAFLSGATISSAVPEPSSIVFLAIGSLGIAVCRPRRRRR
jgi:hypothetical protein